MITYEDALEASPLAFRSQVSRSPVVGLLGSPLRTDRAPGHSYPGLPGWGAKSTAAILARFAKLEAIPADWREWRVNAHNAATQAATPERERDRAWLFRDLATLRTDIPVFDSVDDLRWRAPARRPGEYREELLFR